ncbi:hypothetical protein PRBEI_2001438300 [Prionailurus iriomotensis]
MEGLLQSQEPEVPEGRAPAPRTRRGGARQPRRSGVIEHHRQNLALNTRRPPCASREQDPSLRLPVSVRT